MTAWIRALERTASYGRGDGESLPALIAAAGTKFAARPALQDEATSLSYDDVASLMVRYARWTMKRGAVAGGVIALMMPNRAEYPAIWLGIASTGAVVALINTNLVGDALLHSLVVASAQQIVVDPDCAPAVVAIAERLPSGVTIWAAGPGTNWPDLHDELRVLSGAPLAPGEVPTPKLTAHALLIYTSGTTGLPKAAYVSHRRIAEWALWFAGMADTSPDDRMYNCLPMYHSVGGVVAIGAMLVAGGSVLIRRRFSASRFWDDVVEGECTLFQYIGELCRYLVQAPPHPKETAHRLRLCCGNGLRGEVWNRFKERFGIPHILEFYASTEGNVSLYNVAERPGAIGQVPAFLAHRFPIALVRCHSETRTLLRGEDGLCVRCAPNEVGEALGRIGQTADTAGRPFEGYTDAGASEAKLARDVLAKGDCWFRTGDLMRRDRAGYYYFVDRLGETFRWKGENVATGEVADALRTAPGVSEAVVYGVAVPLSEGRAGMAALTVTPDFELATLRRHVAERLPDYARPVFLRLCDGIAATGTFKPMTAALAREGYDPRNVTDPVFLDDRSAGVYRPLDAALFEKLQAGNIRL